MTPLDRFFNVIFFAFKDGFHPSIRKVFHPSGKVMLPCNAAGLRAKKNPLDTACHYNVCAYFHLFSPICHNRYRVPAVF